MSDIDPIPLAADPIRQAVAALRGYTGQIVRTVRSWVSLGDEQVLYVEGAEDFDIIGGRGQAVAVQVKEVAGSITLATRDVIEAIIHFWQHQRRNPSQTVYFRYLTTAGRGRERNSPFGPRRGLDYWDEAKSSNVDVNPLR